MATPEEEIQALKDARADKALHKLADSRIKSFARNLTPELMRIEEFKSQHDLIVENYMAADRHEWKRPRRHHDMEQSFGESFIFKPIHYVIHKMKEGSAEWEAEVAISKEVLRLHKDIRNNTVGEKDQPVARALLGLDEVTYTDKNRGVVTEKLTWGKEGKSFLQLFDQQRIETMKWHQRFENIHAAKMEMLKPYEKELFEKVYGGKRENIPEPGSANTLEAKYYLARQNAIRLNSEMYIYYNRWNKNLLLPDGTHATKQEKDALYKLIDMKHQNGKSLPEMLLDTDEKKRIDEDLKEWGRGGKQPTQMTFDASEPLRPSPTPPIPRVVGKIGIVGKV